MTIDWNWFFAAFAQSGAALIAIIGAFIISKLLGESEKEEQNSNELEELIIHYKDLKKRVSNRYFDWYDKKNIQYSSDLGDSIKNGDFNGLNDEEKLSKLFEIETNLLGTDSCIDALNERIEKLTPTTTEFGNRLSMVNHTMELNIPPKGMWSNLSEEKEIINSLGIESETLIDQFRKTQNKIEAASKNLVPIKVTIYILMIGIILTVIYPLHFMPLEINQTPNVVVSISLFFELLFSLKGILLFILTLVIEGIFGYFLWLTIRTEKRYEEIKGKILDDYLDIKSYSKYFE